MADKYVEKQLRVYEAAGSEKEQDDALYRLGTHLELPSIPCNGNANLTPEQRTTILGASQGEGNKNG
jgi:hypothetical protein